MRRLRPCLRRFATLPHCRRLSPQAPAFPGHAYHTPGARGAARAVHGFTSRPSTPVTGVPWALLPWPARHHSTGQASPDEPSGSIRTHQVRHDALMSEVPDVSFMQRLRRARQEVGDEADRAADQMGNSAAMVADAVHSLSDLVTDIVTIGALRLSRLPPDGSHSWGYGKYQSLATFVVSLSLVGTGVGIGVHGIDLIQNLSLEPPGHIATAAAVLSIISKEIIFRITLKAAKAKRSDLLIANAWHHRSDAISSMVALCGILGAHLGMPWLDPVAALGVAALIVKMGSSIAVESVRDLVDYSSERDALEEVRTQLATVDDLEGWHDIRSRKMGPYRTLDLHVELRPHLSVTAGHVVSDNVRNTILRNCPEYVDVTVHIDPHTPMGDHSVENTSVRRTENAFLERARATVGDRGAVEGVTLHYLKNVVADVFVKVPFGTSNSDMRLLQHDVRDCALHTNVKSVRVWLTVGAPPPKGSPLHGKKRVTSTTSQ